MAPTRLGAAAAHLAGVFLVAGGCSPESPMAAANGAGDPRVAETPSGASAGAAETPSEHASRGTCYDDGEREICVDPARPDWVWIGPVGDPDARAAFPANGEMSIGSRGVPKMKLQVGHPRLAQAGVSTGPTGALRVRCKATVRQFRRNAAQHQLRMAPASHGDSSRLDPCEAAGLRHAKTPTRTQ